MGGPFPSCVLFRRRAGSFVFYSRVLGTGGMGPKRMWRGGSLCDAWDIALRAIKCAHGADGSEWFLVLREMKWNGSPERLCELCCFLINQGLNVWPMLEFTDDPGDWASRFSREELAGLRALRSKAMKKLR